MPSRKTTSCFQALIISMAILFTAVVSHNSLAQNLVPNPSFEVFTDCPDSFGDLTNAVDWFNWRSSPDYMNECSPSDDPTNAIIDVPYNRCGYQEAHTGQAYAGVECFPPYYLVGVDYREYFGCELNDTLKVGCEYEVEFYTSRANGGMGYLYTYAVRNIGLLFTVEEFNVDEGNTVPIANFAHLEPDNILTDTINWVQVSMTFIADQPYTHLGIGNWFDDSQTDTLRLVPAGEPNGAYYLIDDVCVRGTSPCFADLNNDAIINVFDLLIMLTDFGCTQNCAANLTCDSKVDIQDVLFLLSAFGNSGNDCALKD